MNCECGKPAITSGLCKCCYMAKWRAKNPEYQKAYQRKWRDKEYAKPKDALGIFCEALNCEPHDFARYLLVLRGEVMP